MEYLVGALIPVALFVCFYCGYRMGQKSRSRTIHREVDEDTADKAKQIRRDFQELMSYDVAKAMGKKVT